MAYTMFSAKNGDFLKLSTIKHTAREVRSEIAGELFRDGGWAAAKKDGWRVVRVWVGLDSRR